MDFNQNLNPEQSTPRNTPTPPIPSAPRMTTMPNMPQENSGKKIGPIIGALIIIVLLIIAALYFLGGRLNREQTPMEQQPSPTSASGTTIDQKTTTQTPAPRNDSLDSLSNDLEADDNLDRTAF